MPKGKNAYISGLYEAILSLSTKEECATFLEDLCTEKELISLSHRIEAAKMLIEKKTYDQIEEKLSISTATISRINKCVQYGEGGYVEVLKKISEI